MNASGWITSQRVRECKILVLCIFWRITLKLSLFPNDTRIWSVRPYGPSRWKFIVCLYFVRPKKKSTPNESSAWLAWLGKTSVYLETSFWCENDDTDGIEFSNVIWAIVDRRSICEYCTAGKNLCAHHHNQYCRVRVVLVVRVVRIRCPMCAAAEHACVLVCIPLFTHEFNGWCVATVWEREYIECDVLVHVLYCGCSTLLLKRLLLTENGMVERRWSRSAPASSNNNTSTTQLWAVCIRAI